MSSSSPSLQTKQTTEFKSLVNETRRLLGLPSEEEDGDRNEAEEKHENEPSDTSVVTWGEMRADPIISAFFAERLVSVVVAARINKVIDILTPPPPPPSASSTGPTKEKEAGVGVEGTENGYAHEHKNKNETKLSLLKRQKKLEQRQAAPKDMRLTTDGTTDNFGIKLLVKSAAEIEGKLAKTAGANAIANQTKREEDKAMREANRVQRHLQRLKEQQQLQVKVNPLQGIDTATAPSSVVNGGEDGNEEVEEVEEIEEEEEAPEESNDSNDDEGNEDAPPPPPPDDLGEEGVGADESSHAPPPPPPDDDDDDPPPPPPPDEPEEEGEEEDVPPPPPEDDDLPPPPPPDEE